MNSHKKRGNSVKPRSGNAFKSAQSDARTLCNEYKNLEESSNLPNRQMNISKHTTKRNSSVTRAQQSVNHNNLFHPNSHSTQPKHSSQSHHSTQPKHSTQFNHSTQPKHSTQSNHSTQPKHSAQSKHSTQSKRPVQGDQLINPNPQTEDGREKIAKDTMKIIKEGKYKKYDSASKTSKEVYIKSDIKLCIDQTVTIRPEIYESKSISRKKYSSMCHIKVIPVSSYGAAKVLIQNDKIKNTCVLNFASATQPGGGFLNGRQAQEESLSRQSALYASLTKSNEMYDYHKKRSKDNYYTDYMIYSPGVPVFKNDHDESLLSQNDYFTVNVITSAAPNKAKIEKEKYSMETKRDLKAIIHTRIRKIIKCAIDKGNDALVLGAYGCGVFGNDPKDISKIFKTVLVKEEFGFYFKKVVFAILGPHSENFRAFSAEFS